MSQDSQALILWEPKYLFFPPVQEPPPPTRVFRHIDLVEEEEEVEVRRRPFFGPITPQKVHTPDHEFIFPPLFLNNTFLRFIHDLPKQLPLPLIDLSFSPQGNYYTHRSYWNHRPHNQTNMGESASIEEIESTKEEEEEQESSLESIDETENMNTPMDIDPPSPKMKTKKPTKITLKRKEPEYEDDVFSSDYQIDRSPKTNTSTSAKRVKSNEEASLEQWRVGKRPGYQGSFIAPKKNTYDFDEEEDHDGSSGSSGKRTFGQSITSSAERVLKKPFKPPTQVPPKGRLPTLTKSINSSPSSTPNTNNSSSSNRTLTTHSTPTTNRSSSVDPYFPDFPTPPPSNSKSTSRSNKMNTKPFKTPIRTNRSTAPSPSTKVNRNSQGEILLKTSSRSTSNESKENQTDQQRIRYLQEEIRITKHAIKYHNEDDNDKLKELVSMWRTAGREVVEKLFSIVPKPIDFGVSSSSSSSMTTPLSSTYQGYNSSWNTPSPNFNFDPNTSELTAEQSEWLRNAKRNKNGEIVDDDDNPLIIGESEHEIKSFWEDIGNRGGSSEYGQSASTRGWSTQVNHSDYNDFSSSPPPNETGIEIESTSKSEEWDYSSLMRLFNVDPDLLGWNSVQEDWNE